MRTGCAGSRARLVAAGIAAPVVALTKREDNAAPYRECSALVQHEILNASQPCVSFCTTLASITFFRARPARCIARSWPS